MAASTTFKRLALLAAASLTAAPLCADETPLSWYQNGHDQIEQRFAEQTRLTAGDRARNVILFIGDGMGIATVTAARILEGQQRGQPGEENLLSFEQFPFTALSKTYNTNQQTADSAGTMTAIVTGIKTKAGMIAINQNAERGNCASARGNELNTLLDEAEQAGLATGIVTTARITHATPAATYAKVPERDWEDDSQLSKVARRQGCADIARQLVEYPRGDGIDVMLGGGRRHFLPAPQGKRQDGLNLISQWQQRYPQGTYVDRRADLLKLQPGTSKLLGLFADSHLRYEADRQQHGNSEPSLTEMTTAAMRQLQSNPRGYFLMVEAGRIDHGHHANNAYNALEDTIELSRAVSAALKLVDDYTLIIVTADHSHVFTLGGYATRGNPILGQVVENSDSGESKGEPALADDGLPYTTLTYSNGRGFADRNSNTTDADERYALPIASGRHNHPGLNTQAPGYHQEALIPLEAETHGGEDVAIYGFGPGAQAVRGVMEQNLIYHIMKRALLPEPPHSQQ